MGGKLAILLSFLLAGPGSLGQPSSIYPEQKGVVSDYADKLDDAQIRELSGLIQEYGQRTSIQIVVVVVDNLHGQSAGQYAIELGNRWGVGQPGRNNGVVLLWAPHQHAYSLRIADGLKTEISDSDAKAITQQSLPNFKRERYYAGLKETILATMRRLGDKTWEERMQSRNPMAPQEQQARSQRPEERAKEDQAANRIVSMVVLFLAIDVLAIVVIYQRIRRRTKLAEMGQAKQKIADNLTKAEENVPRIQQFLDAFAKEAPEQDLSALSTSLAEQPARISQIKADATTLNFSDLKSYDEVIAARLQSQAESNMLESMQERVNNIRNAKQRSQVLMEQMSGEPFTISELRDRSRRDQIDMLLCQSRANYEQARQNSSLSVVDWLIIDDLLNRSHRQAQQAADFSRTEPYVPSSVFSNSSGSRSSLSSSSFFGGSNSGGSSSSSFFSSSDSSSSSSSSSFDSSSSGGGGFDSGSGSDGSY